MRKRRGRTRSRHWAAQDAVARPMKRASTEPQWRTLIRAQRPPYALRRQALATIALGLLIMGMDSAMVNVALPKLARDLHASATDMQWIVNAYVLVFAGLLLCMGAVGDRFGRRRAFVMGLVIFAVGSTVAAWAQSPQQLIALRALMGVGGALIMPSTLPIITDIFPPAERPRAIATWAAVGGIGMLAGPIVAGWLLAHAWAGSVFLVNVPLIAVALAAGLIVVPESKDPHGVPLDPPGAGLSIIALGSIVYGIVEASARGWHDTRMLTAFASGAAALATFFIWERRAPYPMLQLALFRNSRFSAACAAVATVFFATLGTMFVLTQQLQFVLGYSPLETGWRLAPMGTVVISAPAAARLAERVGTKLVVASGLALVAIAVLLASSTSLDSGDAPIAWALSLLGIGFGATMAPAADSVMGSLPLAKASVGSAMSDTIRMIGGAFGVAVVGTTMSSSFRNSIAPAVAELSSPAAEAATTSIDGALVVAERLGPTGQPLMKAAQQAFTSAVGDAMGVAAAIAVLGGVIVLVFLPATGPADEHLRARLQQPAPE